MHPTSCDDVLTTTCAISLQHRHSTAAGIMMQRVQVHLYNNVTLKSVCLILTYFCYQFKFRSLGETPSESLPSSPSLLLLAKGSYRKGCTPSISLTSLDDISEPEAMSELAANSELEAKLALSSSASKLDEEY